MYTVGPRDEPQEPESNEDVLSYFEESALGQLPIVKQAIQAVRAYNAKLKAQQEMIDQVQGK